MNKRVTRIYILIALLVWASLWADEKNAWAASPGEAGTAGSGYVDVSRQDANYIFVKYISQQGIINGFPDGSFHPEDGITRAQAAVIMGKAAGLETSPAGSSTFKDVANTHWALNYIEAAVKAGYLHGFPDGSYRPEASLTRAQGISLIMRLCTQNEQAPLPQLNDMSSQHWAAPVMGTAIALNMIGLSTDGKSIYPEANMTRGGMARALAILLTQDPGLNQTALEGKVSEISGRVTLTRNGKSQVVKTDCSLVEGDKIETGDNGGVRISYPDGSSNLLEADSTIVIKESKGQRYIKRDGTAGIAVDYLNMALDQGTIYGALATKHRGEEPGEKPGEEPVENKSMSRETPQRLAAGYGFHYLAAGGNESPATPWYKTAEAKKVKVKVDMPWGIAAIRGTFVKITVNPDKTCRVSCLTGSADLTGQTGTQITLTGNDSANVARQQSSANKEGTLNSEDKKTFGETKVQVFFMDASVEQEVNQSADIAPEAVSEQTARGQESTVKAVIEALKDSGITLTAEAVKELQTKVAEVLSQVDETVAQALQQQVSEVKPPASTPEVKTTPQTATPNTGSGNTGNTSTPLATCPASVTLAPGSIHPVMSVTNVSIPAAGASDSTGKVNGWRSSSADKITFTVVDGGTATSSITINGDAYTSGTDYTISPDVASAGYMTIVVTTSQNGRIKVTRTFVVSVSVYYSAAPGITLTSGSGNGVGMVSCTLASTSTSILSGDIYYTGTVTGWVYGTADTIKLTLPATLTALSTITINGDAYTSGADYAISPNAVSTGSLTIVVTTSESYKVPVTTTIVLNLNSSYASAPGITLASGASNGVGTVSCTLASTSTSILSEDIYYTGTVTGWVYGMAETIKLTLPATLTAVSTIAINGDAYTSGADYAISPDIVSTGSLTIVVTTSESYKVPVTTAIVLSIPAASAPGSVCLAKGTTNPLGAITQVVVPLNGYTDTTGTVTGWVYGTADTIKFTVCDTSPAASTITINGAAYTSGTDYIIAPSIAASGYLTVVVATAETGKNTIIRNFKIGVAVAGRDTSIAGTLSGTYLIGNNVVLNGKSATVGELKAGLVLSSPQASVIILTSGGTEASVSDTVYSTMVVQVTSENNTVAKYDMFDHGIFKLEDLLDINNDINNSLTRRYILAKDLDFNNSASYTAPDTYKSAWTGGTGWTPLGSANTAKKTFTGVFDGNGHKIDNLFINNSKSYLGLFYYVEMAGTIKNLGLSVSITNPSTTAYDHIGAFAGKMRGQLIDSHSSGTIYAPYSTYVGGMVGNNDDGQIIRCSSSVNVSGMTNVGGISGKCGMNICYPLFQNCYATGNVTASGNYAGGIVGYAPTARIIYSYASGSVSGAANVGGLAGYFNNTGTALYIKYSYALNSSITGTGYTGRIAGDISSSYRSTIINCFGNGALTISAHYTELNGTAITLTAAEAKATYSATWDIADVGASATSAWVISDGYSFPVLRSSDTRAPGLTGTTVGAVTSGTASLSYDSDEAGTFYYLVYTSNDSTPGSTAIMAQGTAVNKGSGSAVAGTNTINISGLSPSTAYTVYLIVADMTGSLSAINSFDFTTP